MNKTLTINTKEGLGWGDVFFRDESNEIIKIKRETSKNPNN